MKRSRRLVNLSDQKSLKDRIESITFDPFGYVGFGNGYGAFLFQLPDRGIGLLGNIIGEDGRAIDGCSPAYVVVIFNCGKISSCGFNDVLICFVLQ